MKDIINHYRITLGCKLISAVIRTMPVNWQDRHVINNFMKVGAIKTKSRPKDKHNKVNVDVREKELLTQVAYCAEGMFDCEVNNNLGDAKDWKHQLHNAIDKYYEYLFEETGEQH